MTTFAVIDATDPDAGLPGRGHASGVAMTGMYFGLMARIMPIWAFVALAIVAIAFTIGIVMAPGMGFVTHLANMLDAALHLARPLAAVLAVILLAVPAVIYAAGLAFGQRALMTTGFGED